MTKPAYRRVLGSALLFLSLFGTSAGHGQTRSFAAPEAPATPDGYGADLLPSDAKSRADLLKATAFDATIYGMSAYLQYE